MGLQIVGCGWKQFSRTLEKSQFECPRCAKTAKGASQRYRRESFKKWLTLLWIPVFPLSNWFEVVTCYGCHGEFPPNVLDSRRGPSGGAGDVARPAEDSIPDQIAQLDRLRQSGALTQIEFDNKKQQLLERMASPAEGPDQDVGDAVV